MYSIQIFEIITQLKKYERVWPMLLQLQVFK
jgi:hypothetical protein